MVLDKEQMIKLIKTCDVIRELSQLTSIATGGFAFGKKFDNIYLVYDVVKDNSVYWEDTEENDTEFNAIINAINYTAEEKYELLKLEDDDEDVDYDEDEE